MNTDQHDREDLELRKALMQLADQAPAPQEFTEIIDRPPHVRKAPRRRLLVAAVAVVAVGAGGLWWALQDEPTTTLFANEGGEELPTPVPLQSPDPGAEAGSGTSPTPESRLDEAMASLPPAMDLSTAPAVFERAGTAQEVADAYLEDRFGAASVAALGITAQPHETEAPVLVFGWGWRSEVEPGVDGGESEQGLLFLRQTDGGYEVVAATTSGVDTSQLRVEGSSVTGQILDATGQTMFADVLTADGEPVPSSPRPDGFTPDAPIRFGTAAGPSEEPGASALALDIPIGSEPFVIVRVHLVGGTILAVTEHTLVNDADLTEPDQDSPPEAAPAPWAEAATDLVSVDDPLPSALGTTQPTLVPAGYTRCSGEIVEQVTFRDAGIVVEYCDGNGNVIRALDEAVWATSDDEPFAEIAGNVVTRRIENERQVLLIDGSIGLDAPADLDPNVVLAMIASMPVYDPRAINPASGAEIDLTWTLTDSARVKEMLQTFTDPIAVDQTTDPLTNEPLGTSAELSLGTESWLNIFPNATGMALDEFGRIETIGGIDYFILKEPGASPGTDGQSQVIFVCGGAVFNTFMYEVPIDDAALVFSQQLASALGCTA